MRLKIADDLEGVPMSLLPRVIGVSDDRTHHRRQPYEVVMVCVYADPSDDADPPVKPTPYAKDIFRSSIGWDST